MRKLTLVLPVQVVIIIIKNKLLLFTRRNHPNGPISLDLGLLNTGLAIC